MIQTPILIPGELNSIGDKSASRFDQRCRRGSREVKWVNFHPPFSEPPLFFFFFFSYPSNIEIIFDFSDIITKIHPPFQILDLPLRWYVLNSRNWIDLCIWFGSCEERRQNQSRSTAVIPGWARREERLSRSELYQPFRIDSDAVLHMNLIHWIRFGSCEVWRLNRA